MHGPKFKQLFHSGSQFPTAYSSEIIEGEEVKVLSQVTWQAVKMVQHPVGHTDTVVMFFITVNVIFCETQKYEQKDVLLFGKATGLEEIFHVK